MRITLIDLIDSKEFVRMNKWVGQIEVYSNRSYLWQNPFAKSDTIFRK